MVGVERDRQRDRERGSERHRVDGEDGERKKRQRHTESEREAHAEEGRVIERRRRGHTPPSRHGPVPKVPLKGCTAVLGGRLPPAAAPAAPPGPLPSFSTMESLADRGTDPDDSTTKEGKDGPIWTAEATMLQYLWGGVGVID